MPDTINLDIDYFDHPKVRRLVGILGPGSEVHHIRLMTYTAKHRPGSGGFDDWSAEEIESAADWRGEKSKMVEALIRCGLLHEKNGGYYLHDWKERQPHLVKYEKTKRERKKAADKRWNQERRRKNGRKPKEEGEIEADANGDAKRDFAYPENEFCITKAVQGSAVTTIPSPACARVGEQGDAEGEREETPPYEPPAIPAPLLALSRDVYGLTPEAILTGWMTVQKWPVGWIEKATIRTAEMGKTGAKAVSYAAGIMRDYTRNGGPEEDDSPTQGNRSGAAGKRRTQRRPDQHDVADVLEARRRGRAAASGVGRSDDGFDWGA